MKIQQEGREKTSGSRGRYETYGKRTENKAAGDPTLGVRVKR